jgi:hypothetical protein
MKNQIVLVPAVIPVSFSMNDSTLSSSPSMKTYQISPQLPSTRHFWIPPNHRVYSCKAHKFYIVCYCGQRITASSCWSELKIAFCQQSVLVDYLWERHREEFFRKRRIRIFFLSCAMPDLVCGKRWGICLQLTRSSVLKKNLIKKEKQLDPPKRWVVEGAVLLYRGLCTPGGLASYSGGQTQHTSFRRRYEDGTDFQRRRRRSYTGCHCNGR